MDNGAPVRRLVHLKSEEPPALGFQIRHWFLILALLCNVVSMILTIIAAASSGDALLWTIGALKGIILILLIVVSALAYMAGGSSINANIVWAVLGIWVIIFVIHGISIEFSNANILIKQTTTTSPPSVPIITATAILSRVAAGISAIGLVLYTAYGVWEVSVESELKEAFIKSYVETNPGVNASDVIVKNARSDLRSLLNSETKTAAELKRAKQEYEKYVKKLTICEAQLGSKGDPKLNILVPPVMQAGGGGGNFRDEDTSGNVKKALKELEEDEKASRRFIREGR